MYSIKHSSIPLSNPPVNDFCPKRLKLATTRDEPLTTFPFLSLLSC